MGIFINFLLAIAFFVFSGISISLEAEGWVAAVLILSGIVFIVIGLFKIEEEYGIFSNYLKFKKDKKVDKIYNGKYKATPLNMVPMFIKAYDHRKEYGVKSLARNALSNISKGYSELRKNWSLVAKDGKLGKIDEKEVEYLLFDAVEALLTMFICCDDSADDDYEIYKNFCTKFSHKPLSKYDLLKYNKELFDKTKTDKNGKNNFEKTCEKLNFFKSVCRKYISPSSYAAFAQGFCYASLMDNSVYEDEYKLILIAFFDEGIDVFPDKWEKFKREYK